MTKEQQKFYDIKHTSDYTEIGIDVDYKVYVDDDKKEVVLLFEETDSNTDWKHNFLFFPFPLKLDKTCFWITYGYAKIYKSTNNKPINDFVIACLSHQDYKRCVRGWSLGSAMAKIAVRHLLSYARLSIDELTTYGDVKCWFNPFYSLKNKVKRIREYVTGNDAVTWFHLLFRRDVKCKVGPKFSLKEIFKTEYYHTHYEEYDYKNFEED